MWRAELRGRAAALCERDPGDPQVAEAVELVSALARDYTRGRGFTAAGPCASIQAVIVTAAARLAGNPRQTPYMVTAGSVTERSGPGFVGWSLAELAVLNRYRQRAV